MMPLFRSGSRDLRRLVYSHFINLKLSLKNSFYFGIDLSASDSSVFGLSNREGLTDSNL